MDFSIISSKLLENTDCAEHLCISKVKGIIAKLQTTLFPGHFGLLVKRGDGPDIKPEQWLETLLREIYDDLTCLTNEDIAKKFIDALPDMQSLLYKDAQAGFDGDPAAQSVDEVILTYPGFFAVFVHRIAHFLFKENISLLPRMMSEYAHSITGIDIHPGAQIGESFFIDHGTGVVIGETSVIGNNVKLYQGVTIGALSVKKQQGAGKIKRHPTIEDNVTVYSNASILGGDTVIGEGSIVGGNAFVIKSVPAGTVVKMVH